LAQEEETMSKQIQEAYIVAATRTPVAKRNGMFRNVRPDDMLAHVLKAAVAKQPGLDAGEIGDVIVGCAFPEAEQGLNVARIGLLLAGLPDSLLPIICGMMVIDSVPPAIMTSASPRRIRSAAIATACRPLEQKRLMVMAGTRFGKPASRRPVNCTNRPHCQCPNNATTTATKISFGTNTKLIS
jgi:hypothetical protein